MDARAGADVHDIVRRAHGVLVVLDDDERVAHVAQVFHRFEQLCVVALVQADARLIENVEHAHERGADLRGQPDALRFAAGERRRGAREREILQTDALQKTETAADLLDDAPGDHCLHIGQLRFERVKEAQTLRYGEIAELGDIHSADGDGEDFLPETAAAAVRAERFRHALLDLRAHGRALRFAVTALEVGRDALEGLVERSLAALLIVMERQLLAARAVEDHFARLFRQVSDGGIKTEMVFFRERFKIHARDRVAADIVPAGRHDAAAENGERRVRHNELGIDAQLRAEAGAAWAGAVRVVERERARRELFDGDAAVLAGIVLREREFAPLRREIDRHKAARERGRGFDRIRQTAADIRLHYKTVHDDLNAVLFILVKFNGFGKIVKIAVHAHADITALARVLKDLGVLALLAADDRGEDLELRPLRQRRHLVNDLVNGLLADLLAALRAVRRADARPEQAEIVIDLRHGADGRARVAARRFLVDGNGGRKTVDIVHIRLFHLAEEHARVRRKALHIPALSFGIDRVENERGFARAGNAGEYHELVARDLQRNIF